MKRRSSITKHKELSVRHFRVSETPLNQWRYHCADLMLDSYDSIGLVFVHLFNLMQSCIRSYDMLLSWKVIFYFLQIQHFQLNYSDPKNLFGQFCCIRYSQCDLPQVYTGIDEDITVVNCMFHKFWQLESVNTLFYIFWFIIWNL